MKFEKHKYAAVLTVLLAWLLVVPAAGQMKAAPCITARQLLETIQTYHVAPVAVDSAYSERVVRQLVAELDPYGLYLTQEDVAILRPAFQDLETQVRLGDCGYFLVAEQLFANRYRYVDSLRQALLQKPLQWEASDTIRIFFRQTPLAANTQELQRRWRQQLKYMLLQEGHASTGGNALQMDELLGLKTNVLERLNCRRNRMLEVPDGLQEYVQERVLEAMASSFDPHTNYLPASLKQQFEASLSSETKSFGITLDENPQGDIQIDHLSPGGPAWKSNELHQGDVLLSILPAKGEIMSFSCTSIHEADLLLNDPAYEHIFLTVRKKDGKAKTVELRKEKLKVEENVVQSFVLAGQEKIGYLSLPGFYTQWDEYGQEQGCANDVARELLKLKKEGVAGVILDLRYNGGGSVMEALSLAGIFIDEGPLGIEQSKGDKPRLMKDLNRGTLFDAPLILLVNGFSASASEILAQALQNYHRAVIVGSTTYGKATIQNLYPLIATQEDFVKVTIGKFYNLQGGTYQYKGVMPDVPLEDGLAALGQHESAYPTALRADAVKKTVVYQPLAPLPVKRLSASSAVRLQKNVAYQQQLQQAQALFAATDKGIPVRLSLSSFQQDYDYLHSLLEHEPDSNRVQSAPYQLQTLETTQQLLQLNPERKAAHEQLVQDLMQDTWLEESFYIMLDLLTASK